MEKMSRSQTIVVMKWSKRILGIIILGIVAAYLIRYLYPRPISELNGWDLDSVNALTIGDIEIGPPFEWTDFKTSQSIEDLVELMDNTKALYQFSTNRFSSPQYMLVFRYIPEEPNASHIIYDSIRISEENKYIYIGSTAYTIPDEDKASILSLIQEMLSSTNADTGDITEPITHSSSGSVVEHSFATAK